MLIKDFLEMVCNEINYKPIRKDISEELNLHIQEHKEEYMKEGMNDIEAEERAVFNMGDGIVIGKKLNKIHKPKLDWMLVILVAVLIGFGILVTTIKAKSIDSNWCVTREIMFLIIGGILSIFIYFSNYKKILKYSNFIYAISTVLLCVTISGGGSRVNGYLTFIRIFGITINPIYISSYLYIIAFVGFITNYNKQAQLQILNKKIDRDLIKIAILSLTSIVVLLILNSSRIMVILLAVTYIIISTFSIIQSAENIKRKLSIFYGFILALVIISSIFIVVSKPDFIYYLNVKMQTFFNSRLDPRGNGWMGIQIENVLEQANLLGKQNGENNAKNLFDEGTNYALISIISNYGLVVAGIIILTIIALFIKLIISSRKVKDKYGKLMIIGLSSIILLQSLFNVLMNFRLIPLIDIGLPFVSYGINGLIINMMSIAFILSIYRRKDILLKNQEYNKKLKIKFYYE